MKTSKEILSNDYQDLDELEYIDELTNKQVKSFKSSFKYIPKKQTLRNKRKYNEKNS